MMPERRALCSHCLVPTGGGAYEGSVAGVTYPFCCFGCYLAFRVGGERGEEAEAAWLLIRLGVGAFLAMNVMVFSILLYAGAFSPEEERLVRAVHYLLWALATPVLLILGVPFLREAWQAGREGRLSAETLIAVGSVAAYVYSALAVVAGREEVYFDTAAMLLVLFTLGRYLEAVGRARAARTLAPVLESEREWATVLADGEEMRRRTAEVQPGDLVRVRPGERIPVDGLVLEGRSAVDEALLTGEARPVVKAPGSRVLAGSMNGEGQLLVRTTASGVGTRWAHIGKIVREALSCRGRLQRISDRAAAAFVPAVLALALGTVLFWSGRGPFGHAMLSGLAVLVVACPCALGLATPLATSLGIGRAAQQGVLIRDGSVFEILARIRAVSFDKTGTVTSGMPRLIRIEAHGIPETRVLERAGSLELGSEHPLGRAIAAAARDRGLPLTELQEIQAKPGIGIIGYSGEERIAAGRAELITALNWRIPPELAARARTLEDSGRTVVYVGWDGSTRGLLVLDDTLRSDATHVVAAVQGLGLRTFLMSGDLPSVVSRTAGTVGVDAWWAGLSPEEKLATLSDLTQEHGPVAMVGDGLNDGPVLAGAAVGIAVGSATDLARETADVVIHGSDLTSLPWVIALARAVRRTIYINLTWAFGYNLLALTAAALGLLQPILAAGLMAGSSLLVVVNSLRLERFSDERSLTG